MFGLPHVETRLWGGLLVTLVISFTGIIGSLPLGILLALGRRSELPIVRTLSHRLHRVLARRAADHGAVLRHLHAAAVPAGELEDRRAAARADRRRAVRRRLSGGGDPRRPAGDPARPVRGRDGARPGLLAHDRSGHHAAGAEAGDPRPGQFVHRAVQGHHAGADRGDLRPARAVAGGVRRPELGDPGDVVHRLCLCRHHLFSRQLRHVALCAGDGAAADDRARGEGHERR